MNQREKEMIEKAIPMLSKSGCTMVESLISFNEGIKLLREAQALAEPEGEKKFKCQCSTCQQIERNRSTAHPPVVTLTVEDRNVLENIRACVAIYAEMDFEDFLSADFEYLTGYAKLLINMIDQLAKLGGK
jgi:hypothetical protein